MAGQHEAHLLRYIGASLTNGNNGNNASWARLPSPPFTSLTHKEVKTETK